MSVVEKESIMDIGKHCSKCHRIDFLPFQCEFCKLVFCGDHRKLEQHQCPGLQDKPIRRSASPEGPTAASLFPNRDNDRIKINQLLKDPKPTTLKEKSTAVMKLTKFLHLQKLKRQSKTSLFSKKTSPIVELQSLKKVSKGDVKIKPEDRIYIWCLYLKHEDFEKIDSLKDRKGIFINKNWSIGKILDYISDQLSIINKNNQVDDPNERLNIFKIVKDQPELIKNSSKGKDLKNGETLYLVRGL